MGQAVTAAAEVKVDAPQVVPAAAQRSLPTVSKAAAAAESDEVPFRPTMGDADYAAAKAAAAAAATPRPAVGTLAPPTVLQGGPFPGGAQAGQKFAVRPPDVELAAGGGASQHVVETVNSLICFYDHTGSPVLASDCTPQNSFFGKPFNVFNDSLFDTRVLYDQTWNRWVILADSFSAGGGAANNVWMAISQTDDATGPFYIYVFNPMGSAFQSGDFFDYPILGMDQDAIQLTGNVFGSTSFKGAYLLSIAKAALYNGQGFSIPIFTGLCATLTPNVVFDQNANTYLTCAGGNRSNVPLYRLNNSSRPNGETLVVQALLPVAPYSVPPRATQPGTTATIDTLDARFVNVGTQRGCSVYQAHSVAVGTATGKWYRFNTCNNTTEIQQLYFASGTSADWNTSIAANANGEVFTTWSSVDTANGVLPEVRIGGSPDNGATAIGAGASLDGSLSYSTQGRWGDYSAVSLDPVAGATAGCGPNRHVWIANELMAAPDSWTTDFAQLGYCS